MIHYTLVCDKEHRFDGWFQSADAFDGLLAQGHVSCGLCGSTRVAKDLMAPAVAAARDDRRAKLADPADGIGKRLAELRRHIEENSEYVGLNFAAEARAIHEGDAPSRSIHGEARRDEARKLVEDGVPVAPLPFLPARRTN